MTRGLTEGRSAPFDIITVPMVALLTVADIVGRRFISPLAILVVAAPAVAVFLSGVVTAAAVANAAVALSTPGPGTTEKTPGRPVERA